MAIKKSTRSSKKATKRPSKKATSRKASRRNPAAWRKTGSGGWAKGNLGVTYLPGRGYVGHTSKEDGPILATRKDAQSWAEAHAVTKNPMGGTYMVTHANPGKSKAKKNPYDDKAHAIEDLFLTATNDGDLYRQQAQPIIANLAKKMAKGAYSRTLATKAWGYLAESGAKKCAWQQGRRKMGTRDWHQQGIDGNGLFPKPLRDAAAAQMEEHYREAVEEAAEAIKAKAASKGKAKKNPKAPSRRATKRDIHLMLPRGGTACGAKGTEDSDIEWVTCPKCLRIHEKWENAHSNPAKAKRVPKRKNVPSSGLDRYSVPGGEWIQQMNPKNASATEALYSRVRACMHRANIGAQVSYHGHNQVQLQVTLADRYPPPSLVERKRARIEAALKKCGLSPDLGSARTADGYAYISGVVHAA